MMQFVEVQSCVENYWRALILFGRNVASYKFALGKALLELRAAPGDLIKLDDLAVPFVRNICEHLQNAPKQGTSQSSEFGGSKPRNRRIASRQLGTESGTS